MSETIPPHEPGAPATEQPPSRGPGEGRLTLPLRARVNLFKAVDEWEEVVLPTALPLARTALLLCDVWDRHWCAGANRRLAAMLPRMNEVVQVCRAVGMQIIHSPSDTMGAYDGTPFRRRAQLAPAVDPPDPLPLPDPALPVDASDGGCDDEPQCHTHKAWNSQHSAIGIADPDVVTDSGQEVYNLLRQRGLSNLIVMGVHTNMCVLHRSFGLKQMTRWGIRCVLIRDLTDTMYNPKLFPHVPHERGTELVVRYIEQHWCPTVLSAELIHSASACS